jgi:hypothetical protein
MALDGQRSKCSATWLLIWSLCLIALAGIEYGFGSTSARVAGVPESAAPAPAPFAQDVILLQFGDSTATMTPISSGPPNTVSFEVLGSEGKLSGDLHAGEGSSLRWAMAHDYPDVHHFDGIKIRGLSMESFSDFQISVEKGSEPGADDEWAYGYRAFYRPTRALSEVTITFDEFTEYWDLAANDPVASCTQNDKYCQEGRRENLRRLSIWAQAPEVGQADVKLTISEIRAFGCVQREQPSAVF